MPVGAYLKEKRVGQALEERTVSVWPAHRHSLDNTWERAVVLHWPQVVLSSLASYSSASGKRILFSLCFFQFLFFQFCFTCIYCFQECFTRFSIIISGVLQGIYANHYYLYCMPKLICCVVVVLFDWFPVMFMFKCFNCISFFPFPLSLYFSAVFFDSFYACVSY